MSWSRVAAVDIVEINRLNIRYFHGGTDRICDGLVVGRNQQ